MRLNHLDLQVSDVQRFTGLLEDVFGFRQLTSHASPAIAILDDGEGFTLVLQKKPRPAYPKDFHFGFLVPDPETVKKKQTELKARGLHVSDVIENGRGVLVYCRTWDGIMIEVSWHRPR
ncbi:MAG: VOC family protein [Myxococcales bacterium]|nr:VOC family protein [Myxococcales bacterium]